jgi:hypothetical protein
MTHCKRPSLFPINLRHEHHRKHIIVDVFTDLLLSTGHGADHIENKPRDNYLARKLARWLLRKSNTFVLVFFNKINFIDLSIEKTHNILQLGIYRKPTATDLIIHD